MSDGCPRIAFGAWRFRFLVACALAAGAGVASAQPAQSRQEELNALRAQKATELHPYVPGKIEKGLIFLQTGGYIERLFTPRDGFFPRLSGITPGGGAAGGPGYRRGNLFRGRANLLISAAGLIKQYWVIDGLLSFPRLARGRAFGDVSVSRSDFPQEDFYGVGPDTDVSARTSYDLRNTRVGGALGVRLTPSIVLGQRLDYAMPDVRGGGDDNLPSTHDLFTDVQAPGLDDQPDFLSTQTFLTVDRRQPGPNARQGSHYLLGFTRYFDRDLDRYNFTQWQIDLQQYLPILRGHRVLALRAAATFSEPVGDQQVPFFLMPTMGGSHMVRAFPSLRFRDRHTLLLQAEYRWEILPFLTGAVFYDTGTVEPEIDALSLGRLKHDYGVGLRWGSARGVFFRTDIAIGGDHGSRFLLRFNNAF